MPAGREGLSGVLYSEVRRRLAVIPTSLPPAPAQLLPVALADDGTLQAGRPDWPIERRRAAVLVLILPDEQSGEAQVVLVERAPGPHRHAGQVAFPGGALEVGESAVAAALREAHEEIGLEPGTAGLTVVGTLPAIDVPVSGFLVDQVIAFADRRPTLTPDGHEVTEVFSAPIAAFLPDAPIELVSAERDGLRLRYGAYRVGRHVIWGATAGMLGRLGAHLAQQVG